MNIASTIGGQGALGLAIALVLAASPNAATGQTPEPGPVGRLDIPKVGATAVAIRVEGGESDAGQMLLALFDGPDGFTADPTLRQVLRLDDGVVVWTLSLPPGRYAVAAIHDRDLDGELDTGLFGIPKEPYGFSNDARGRTGPPSFDDAAFVIDRESRQIVFRVRE